MKIGIATLWFGDGRGGGAETVVRKIASGFVDHGHEVSIIASQSARDASDDDLGFRVERFSIAGRWGYTCFGVVGDREEFYSRIERCSFDCIVIYAAQTWACDLLLAGKVAGRRLPPLVFVTCGFSGLVGLRRVFYGPYFRRMVGWLKLPAAVICHDSSYVDYRFCADHGVRPIVIPNGVDSLMSKDDGFRVANGLTRKKIVITIGNHLKNKGHAEFIRLITGLDRQDVVGFIVGGDVSPGRRSCWKRCVQLGADSGGRIRLTGPLSAAQVREVLGSADVFLFTSKVEASPLVLIEAMAAGVPFVSTEVGNAKSMDGGFVCKDSVSLRRALLRCLDDAPLAKEMGRRGQEQVERSFLWRHIIGRYVNVVEGVVRGELDG